jgi:hypothetical protein
MHVKFQSKCTFLVKVYWHDYNSSLIHNDCLIQENRRLSQYIAKNKPEWDFSSNSTHLQPKLSHTCPRHRQQWVRDTDNNGILDTDNSGS